MQPSDPPYKVLFQDPSLFEEAVRLVAPQLADMLDFETATSLDKEHLTALDRVRVQDKLRRVEFKEGTLRNGRRRYLLALLEFQSGHNADMAWRMRDYLHQVESALRESGAVRAEGAVPPMLSMVVHNGDRPWRAETKCAAPLTGDGAPLPVRTYATVDLQVLARGPTAKAGSWRKTAAWRRWRSWSRHRRSRCRGCCWRRSSATTAWSRQRCGADCTCA